jgi:hypothetical protein
MQQRTITCPACGQTHDVEAPDGSPYAVCPLCGAVAELEAASRQRLKLRMRPDETRPAEHPSPTPPSPTPADRGTGMPAASAPRPEPSADPVPPPLPAGPAGAAAAAPFPSSAPVEEESATVFWLKFAGKVLAFGLVLFGIHVVALADLPFSYFFGLVDRWYPLIIAISLLYLAMMESFPHFLLLLVGPLAVFFGALDMATLTMDDHLGSAKSIFVSVSLVVIAIAYPIYVIYVVVRIIESWKFKVSFFALLLASFLCRGYDVYHYGKLFYETMERNPAAAQGVHGLMKAPKEAPPAKKK